MIEWQKVTRGQCRNLADVPAGAEIVVVNGRECIGGCEVCGGPILDGQKHNHDQECVMWHERCPRTANNAVRAAAEPRTLDGLVGGLNQKGKR